MKISAVVFQRLNAAGAIKWKIIGPKESLWHRQKQALFYLVLSPMGHSEKDENTGTNGHCVETILPILSFYEKWKGLFNT